MTGFGEKEFRERATVKLLQIDKNIKKDDLYFGSFASGYSLGYRPCYPETSNADFDVWCDIINGTIKVYGNLRSLVPTIREYKSIDDFEINL